jgi:hypothetical protein
MRAAPPGRRYDGEGEPLVSLIERLSAYKSCRQVTIRRPGLSLTLGRQGAA